MTKKYIIYGKVFHRHLRIFVKLIADLVGLKGYVSNEDENYVSLVLDGSLEKQNFLLDSLKNQFRQDEISIKACQEIISNDLAYTKFDIV